MAKYTIGHRDYSPPNHLSECYSLSGVYVALVNRGVNDLDASVAVAKLERGDKHVVVPVNQGLQRIDVVKG